MCPTRGARTGGPPSGLQKSEDTPIVHHEHLCHTCAGDPNQGGTASAIEAKDALGFAVGSYLHKPAPGPASIASTSERATGSHYLGVLLSRAPILIIHVVARHCCVVILQVHLAPEHRRLAAQFCRDGPPLWSTWAAERQGMSLSIPWVW
jgi:hypothetical protein